MLWLAVAYAANVAEMMLGERVLHIAIQNKIKACRSIEAKLRTFAKISVFCLTSLPAEWDNIFV